LINKFPSQKNRYIKEFENRYNYLLSKIINENPFCYEVIEKRKLVGKWEDSKLELLCKLVIDLRSIWEYLNQLLNPEKAISENDFIPKPNKKELEKSSLTQPQTALLAYYLRKNKLVSHNADNKLLANTFSQITGFEVAQFQKTLKLNNRESWEITDIKTDFSTLVNKQNHRIGQQ